jgi:GTP cyclohydrolase I
MDVKVSDRAIHTESNDEELKKPSREEAMDAVRTLISWAGDDPEREGLIETPKRVVKAYEEFFAGYAQDPVKVLGKTFEDVKGYDDIVFLRDINIETKNKVVGISKLARVIEIFAKRLQTQETMTMQILNTIDDTLDPYGTAIMIDAKHQCMTTRGINKPNVSTVTTKFSGSFSNDTDLRQRFMQLTKG